MTVSYPKKMRDLAKAQETHLITIDVPGLEYQTPSGTDKQVAELLELFAKWSKRKEAIG